ncbi:MAG TPA: hypothetical protein VIH93_13770 [Thermoanaerobaculia bacterium]|jgi:hypothetical protein
MPERVELATERARAAPLEPPSLDAIDLEIVRGVESAIADGIALQRWWERTDAAGSYAERFELVRTFNPADSAYGFFGSAPLPGRDLPVMGVFQEMFYDRPKGAEARFFRDQLREFVLRYFLRVSDFRLPVAWAPADRTAEASPLPAFSWCPSGREERGGFGYSQLYYKLAGSGRIGKFPLAERSAVTDLREIGPVYEWVVLKVRIFNFDLDFHPLGADGPYVALPLQEETLVVLHRAFIRSLDDPEPGLLGKYGFGYALLRNPADRGLLAYGPGRFDAGFQLVDFKIRDDGEIRVCLTFVVNRPERLLNLGLDPIGWGMGLADLMSLGMASRFLAPVQRAWAGGSAAGAEGPDPIFAWIAMVNLLTGGRAASDLCISRERLEKDMLIQHFTEHYTLISGSLATWRRVPDWRDRAALPERLERGEACR